MATKFGDAAYALMKQRKVRTISSDDLWNALPADLTEKTPTRKTPRTTCMRDLRKDSRFTVSRGTISLERGS